ncbi:C-X-C motif chemokine 9-like isoform X3 [Dicentrarchus labrax]|uniref:C-X-C motif chemokine 9-like isoform X3 n=1 Tax=Dicentrarchus labrax TaxID=13489 RepID=UPI0021F56D3F|nr:C-X-C motif chemokine 9-like isoform X3 [Dicentrarchus labrax]
MNPAAIAFLTCLFVFSAQGLPANRSNTCKCLNGYLKHITPQSIKAVQAVHLPNIFCPHTEIIITTTANKDKCVDPKSKLGKLILNNMNKQKKNGAVSTTTASSSTRLYTTSRL